MTTLDSPRIDALTATGPVSLVTRDAARLAKWYETALGLVPLAAEGRVSVLGAADGTPILTLVSDPDAGIAVQRQSGLFHMAMLLPTRADLGRWLRHTSSAGVSLEGAADHLVSEAVYLSDPEGNGIEVYRDRPRGEWPMRGSEVHMENAPLDAAGILAAGDKAGGRYASAPAGTVVGHVHLKVSDLKATRAFYVDQLGLSVTNGGYPGALFVAAGGYHHHLGLNIWQSAGRARIAGTTGLDAATLTMPMGAAGAVVERLEAAGIAVDLRSGLPSVVDPSGNRIVLVEGQADAIAALAAAGA